MAATIVQINRRVPGDSFQQETTVQGDNSYPTGGYIFTPQQFGYSSHFRRILEISPLNFASAAVVPVLIPTFNNGIITSLALQLQVFASGAEVANATNVTAYTFLITTEGI